ncbi:MAG TPA: FAD-binding protein [Spirochaetota bacterium]|nr:FAD-binding protein [Spirochaetota bacterium]HOD14741.1 FAD-binding protein [Spirochaetota bacterium]HPG49892.1 FAD-binding protein [Spirochaetota bacterium]HPN11513.1 FAD-binding protein [Spirochaetota bacterium]
MNVKNTNQQWDEEFDVVVVGFGGAGACAAIEAADNGARVLAIDRFTGGGATRLSGGVIYSGGGTRHQKAAGFNDTPEKMYRYMMREMASNPACCRDDEIDPAAMKAFCERSSENIDWLEGLGLVIPETYFPGKTNQPPGGFGLYFSGNEKQYSDKNAYIPRGHVPLGKGMSGGYLYSTLRKAALDRGVAFRSRCRSEKIITDDSGAVAGIEVLELNQSPLATALHALLYNLGFVSSRSRRLLARVEKRFGKTLRIRSRGGVIISSGGFVYNRKKFNEYAPAYSGCLPLGTAGDDGSGMDLGMDAGGTLSSVDVCAASRFLYPPVAFVSGLLSNMEGKRFCDESLYGASISRAVTQQPERRAYLVIDSTQHRDGRLQTKREEKLGNSLISVLKGEQNHIVYRKLTTFVNLHMNRKKAGTIAGLAKKCGIPAEALVRTVDSYNGQCSAGTDREFGKPADYLRRIEKPPFYAIDCRIETMKFPSTCLTMGGLKVKGLTSQAVRADGKAIPGLYAAGRSAAGICSRSYVSGFSLADCIFSGRNAGAHAAAQAGKKAAAAGRGRRRP